MRNLLNRSQSYFFSLFILISGVSTAVSAEVVRGIVTGADRRPLAGADVHLVRDHKVFLLESDLKPYAEARSNAKGEFTLQLPDTTAPLALIARAEGHRLMRFPLMTETPINKLIGLRLEPGTTISGKVVDGKGDAVANAPVGPLVAGYDEEREIARTIVPQWTTTGSDGSFEFKHVRPGVQYQFTSYAKGFQISNTAARAGQKDVKVELHPGGSSISGKVFSANPATAVPFADIRVRLNGNGFDHAVPVSGTGAFSIDGIPAGSFSVEPVLEVPRATRLETINMPGDNKRQLELEISSGYYIEGQTVDATTNAPVPGVGLRIADIETTSSANGRFYISPLFDARQLTINIPGTAHRLAEGYTDAPVLDGFTNTTGLVIRVHREHRVNVTLDGFNQTTGSLRVRLAEAGASPSFQTATTGSITMRTFTEGEHLLYALNDTHGTELTTVTVSAHETDVRLRVGLVSAIRGKIETTNKSPETTAPRVYQVRVEAGDWPTSVVVISETSTAADGSFAFPALPVGEFWCTASNASANDTQTREVSTRPGGTEFLNFIFEGGKRFAGIVLGGDGKPLPSVSISYVAGTAGRVQSGRLETDESGRFSIDDLRGDVIRDIFINHHLHAPYRARDIALPQTDYQIALQKLAALRVRVEAPVNTAWKVYVMLSQPMGSGSYAEQITSRIFKEMEVPGGEAKEVEMDSEGRFHFVAIGAKGEIAVSDAVAWNPQTSQEQEIILTPGRLGNASVTMMGKPAGEVNLTAVNTTIPDGKAVTEFAQTTSNDSYTFANLPPGDYLFLADGAGYNGAATNVEVSGGMTATARIEAAVQGDVKGVVTFAGSPFADAEVTLTSETNPDGEVRKADSDAVGNFIFRTVPADRYTVLVTAKTSEGELKAQRTVEVPRSGIAAPVMVDLTPAPTIAVQFPAELDVTPGASITLMNKDTRESNAVKWNNQSPEVELKRGTYEVWLEDQVLGTVEADANGNLYMKK